MEASHESCRNRGTVSRSDEIERVSTVQTSEASWLLSTRSLHRGCVSQMIRAAGNDARKAATAGNVCTMSPSDPSRTARKRASAMRSLANGIEKRARGMILGIADDGHAN